MHSKQNAQSMSRFLCILKRYNSATSRVVFMQFWPLDRQIWELNCSLNQVSRLYGGWEKARYISQLWENVVYEPTFAIRFKNEGREVPRSLIYHWKDNFKLYIYIHRNCWYHLCLWKYFPLKFVHFLTAANFETWFKLQ